jgi:glutamate 5-kinase
VVGARRVVVKIGSHVLTAREGLNVHRLNSLCDQMARFCATGREVIIVSSGAVASGFKKIGLKEKPKTVRKAQACAAVGQAHLIMAYERAWARHGRQTAQVLLTASDLIHRRRYVNAHNTLTMLLEWRIIPIINENDTVTVDELTFGDNDTLAGMITGLVEADLFVNLTDIDGLFESDPRTHHDARLITEVAEITGDIQAMASQAPGELGAGGMYTKVAAARRVARRGVPSVIANGVADRVLDRLLAGETVGTLFLPQAQRLSHRKHWLAFTAKPQGRVWVDDGAKNALLKRGKSLLPIGILSIEDQFDLGDVIEVVASNGEVAAVGLTNYASEELRLIAGCRTNEIKTRLGYSNSDEVIHRDNMVVGGDLEA